MIVQKSVGKEKEYTGENEHIVYRGDNLGDTITIGGDKYKVKIEADKSVVLSRYNKKYEVWVNIKFTESTEELGKEVIRYLKNSYITRTLKDLEK